MIPLTKTLEPSDFEALAEPLQVVDRYFTTAAAQHPMRQWEYGLAIHALDQWLEVRRRPTAGAVVDVGGAGSPFYRMIGDSAIVIDPQEGWTLAAYIDSAPRMSQAVFCLSVIEHIEDLDQFLYHLSCLVAPGGLLFLTFDCREDDQLRTGQWAPDDRHFAWMRQRIFTVPTDLHWLIETFAAYQCHPLGPIDFGYHGPHVYDYSFGSLALVKRA